MSQLPDLDSLVDAVRAKEAAWQRKLGLWFGLPSLIVVVGLVYASWKVASAEKEYMAISEKKAQIEASLASRTEEIRKLDARLQAKQKLLVKKDTEVAAANTLLSEAKPSLSPQDQLNVAAVQQASASPTKTLSAYAVVCSLGTLEAAKAWADRFSQAHPGEKLMFYKSVNKLFAVTLGGATTPEAAHAQVHRAKTELGVRDAYFRLSTDWVKQD